MISIDVMTPTMFHVKHIRLPNRFHMDVLQYAMTFHLAFKGADEHAALCVH